jgi:hypothetical protein
MLLSALGLLTTLLPQAPEVPFRMGDNAIIVDAVVNGHKLSLMFDTGFGGAVVADENIDLGTADGTMTLRDFVGQFEAHTVKIKSFKLGDQPMQLSDMEAVQQPLGRISMSYNTHTDGILGFQAIQGFVTEINFQKKMFVLHPKSYDVSQRQPDGKTTFLLKMLPIGINSVEMPVITGTGKRMVMALDTGNAFYATTHRDVLERVGLWEPERKPKFIHASFVASGAVDSWEKKMPDLTIFGVPVKNSYWDIIDLPSSSATGDGTVGIQFLKNFNITIDYERRRVWLENFSGKVENEPDGIVGIAAAGDRRSGNVRILKVAPDSPAKNAGIAEGDQILEIDGQEVSATMTFRQIDALLTGKPGSKVNLAISHAGALKRYELERAPLYND